MLGHLVATVAGVVLSSLGFCSIVGKSRRVGINGGCVGAPSFTGRNLLFGVRRIVHHGTPRNYDCQALALASGQGDFQNSNLDHGRNCRNFSPTLGDLDGSFTLRALQIRVTKSTTDTGNSISWRSRDRFHCSSVAVQYQNRPQRVVDSIL